MELPDETAEPVSPSDAYLLRRSSSGIDGTICKLKYDGVERKLPEEILIHFHAIHNMRYIPGRTAEPPDLAVHGL